MNDVEAHELVTTTARSARVAQRSLARAPRAVKDAALEAMAHSLTEHGESILAANAADLERGRQGGMKAGLLDRLAVDGSKDGVTRLNDSVETALYEGDGECLPYR